MKKFIKILFFIFTIGFILNACKKKSTLEIENYIEWCTGDNISVKDNFEVRIKNNIEVIDINENDLQDLFKINPPLKGTVERNGNRIFIFKPSKKLDFKEEYEVNFNLNKISKNINEEFAFKTKTNPLEINIQTSPLKAYSEEYQYCTVHIKSNEFITKHELKDFLKLDNNSGKINWLHNLNSEQKNITLLIDSIKRKTEDYTINLSWDGAYLNNDSKGKIELTIPGKDNFKILDVKIEQEPSQVISIHFSDPIQKKQNFNGLVTLKGVENLQYKVDNNILKAYPPSRLKTVTELKINNNLKNISGFSLKENYTDNLTFEQLKPNIKLLNNGNILPNSEGLFLNFETTSIHSVQVRIVKIFENNILQFLQRNNLGSMNNLKYVGKEIKKTTVKLFNKGDSKAEGKTIHSLDLSTIIHVDPNAIYRVELKFNGSNSAYSCQNPTKFNTKERYNEYNDEYYYDYNYSKINYRDKNNPCTESYYYYNRNKTKTSTNILASNIGLTAKKTKDNTYYFSSVNMLTNDFLTGTKISIYTKQMQLISSVKTDNEGLANVNIGNEKAYFAIAEHLKDKVYLKLADGNALSVSKFDVSGVHLMKGLKGCIYLDRGVRRPGDKIPVTFVLDDSKNTIPEEQPVTFELYNSKGKLVKSKVIKNNLNKTYSYTFKTNKEDITGNWNTKVKVGGAIFSKNVKIETIKPNRLKIKTNFGDNKIINTNKEIKSTINTTWLHGAKAGDLNVDVRLKTNSIKTSFKSYPTYYFDNPVLNFKTNETTLFDGKLDKDGKASFILKPSFNQKSPGFLKADFLTKVYEKGGDFSSISDSKIISPYNSYVGMQIPKADNRYNILFTEKDHTIKVVNVNNLGKPLNNKELKVRVYKINWRWWWHSGRDNLSNYINNSTYSAILDKKLTTNSKGETSFKLNINKEEWGRYLIYIEDTKSKHATSKTVYIDWPTWQGRAASGNSSAATMLSFSTDKEEYNVNENAVLSIPSTEGGRALISIENGSSVLETHWVKTKEGETKFTLPITAKMTPNIYINITLLQKHNQTKNDIPIRTYGIKGIKVINPKTVLKPVLNMPKELKPNEEFEIEITEENNKAMTYTIQIVDEGLLDLTRYQTPNLWNVFYAKEALGVKTWDIYDDVIGAYGGTINQILSIGGDGDLAGSKVSKKANRFKPVAIHLGPFEIKNSERRKHKIKLPNYVGSVKTMVVATNNKTRSYGSVNKNTPVKKPIMALVSAPRQLTPTEKFILPVTIFAMDKKVKNVDVKLKTNEGIKIIGDSKKTVHFSREGDKIVNFNLEVLNNTKIGKIEIIARSGKEKSFANVEFDIENPNPISSLKYQDILTKEKETTIDFEVFGEEGTNNLEIEFSNFPSLNINGRLGNLIRYPYGCLEQTTSKVFPQLYLATLVNLSDKQKQDIRKNIKKAIAKLASFQKPNGGLSYWPNSSYYESWAEVYAAHFIIEAEAYGYTIPNGMKTQLINHFVKKAKVWRNNNSYSYTTQAYRLFVLAKTNKADVSAMNRLREEKNLPSLAKYRLAHAYSLIGQNHIAKELISSINNTDYLQKKNSYNNFGSEIRDKAFVLETQVAMNNLNDTENLSTDIAKALNSNDWLSTQTTAYALKAMAKFAEKSKSDGLSYSFNIDNIKEEDLTSNNVIELYKTSLKKGSYQLKIKNHKEGNLFVSMVSSGKYPVGKDLKESRGLEINTNFTSFEGKNISVDTLKQGTNIVAEISIFNPSKKYIKNIALSQLIPNGWEIVETNNSSFNSTNLNSVDFVDIRDNRIDYFFSLRSKKKKVFKILLNTSYLGEFFLPGVQAEAMYDNDYFVRGKGQWIKVTKE